MLLGEPEKIHWTLQQGTSLFQIQSFDSGMCPLESWKTNLLKITVEQNRAYSELSFKLGLKLLLQWLCKILFSESVYFKLKVLIAVSLGEPEKQICCMQQGTGQSIFRVIFQIRFNIITTMILQNTIFMANLFWIESSAGWMCTIGHFKSIW